MSSSSTASRIDLVLAWAAIVIGASAWFHPLVAGADLWWQLAAGREIVRTGGIPAVDGFSFTAAGAEWTNHEWLWEALYWLTYTAHPDAVACLNLFVITATFALVAGVAWRSSGSLFAAGVATWVAAAASHWFMDVRPHLFSLLFVAVLLLTRERRWAPWLWPPLFLIWVNLHSGFVFGFGLLGLHVIFRTWEESRAEKRLVWPRAEWIALVATALATLFNPYGYRILEYPLAYLDSTSLFRTHLIEWHPPRLGLDPRGYAGRFVCMLALSVLSLPRSLRRAPFLVALALVGALMALSARRFIPLFCITAAPVAAIGLAYLVERVESALPATARRMARTLMPAGALLVGLLLWSNVRFFPHPLYRWTQSEAFPAGAVEYLRLLPEPPRRLLNLYDWGGYLTLQTPEIPVFIDGRANTLYSEELYAEYREVVGWGAGAESILSKHGVDAVLMPPSYPIAQELPRRTGRWGVAYHDPIAMLLLPAESIAKGPALPDPTLALPAGPERWLVRGRTSQRRGETELAEEAYAKAVELNPLLVPAYSQLLHIAARRNDREAIERWTAAALDAYPRQAVIIEGKSGRALARIGDVDAALAALRRAIPRGPFSSPGQVEGEIEQLEAYRRGERQSP